MLPVVQVLRETQAVQVTQNAIQNVVQKLIFTTVLLVQLEHIYYKMYDEYNPNKTLEEQAHDRCRSIACSRARRCVCMKNNHLWWQYRSVIEAVEDSDDRDRMIKQLSKTLEKQMLKQVPKKKRDWS
jgi:hypothetical protein